MKDHEIINQIRKDKPDEPIAFLYKEYPKIKALILSSGGNKAEAREIFHDSLILLIEKISDPDFQLSSKISTYLYGINRFLWKNTLRKKNSRKELDWPETLIVTETDLGYQPEKEEKIQILEKILEKITQRCREIFTRFYFEKQSMNEIASAMGFSNVNSAKTRKYKCIEQAIRISNSHNNAAQ